MVEDAAELGVADAVVTRERTRTSVTPTLRSATKRRPNTPSFHRSGSAIWDIKDDEFDGLRLKNVPHGMNSFMTHDVCRVLSALNPPQSHRKFLQEMCGMTEREVRRALLSQTAYQACGRGILRDPD